MRSPFNFFTSLLFVFFSVSCSLTVYSQTVNFGFNIGASQPDQGISGHVDAAGNIYSVGEFQGTNVDFDPSAGTMLLSSNAGSIDCYVSKFNSVGQLLFAFQMGGAGIDKAQAVTTDAAGNIYVTGFFRGANVDFDPSPATFLLTSNGEAGGDPGYGGDIFVAKYSSTGAFVWAFNVGGIQVGDAATGMTADGSGGVFITGYFHVTADFDPSPATVTLNASSGTAFIAHYNTNGQYLWAYNFGVESHIFNVKSNAAGEVYFTGYFQGSNIDLDPSAATAMLNSAGGYDIFVAKYNFAGQYQFAFRAGGTGNDVGRDVTIDNTGNVYVIGDFMNTNIDFDPSPTATALLSSNGSNDVFIAKYTSTGQYVWASNAGSAGGEFGWGIANDGTHLFVTGSFTGVADFDPGPNVENLTSNGGYDIFLAKYDFDRNYQCSFRIGGGGNDIGAALRCPGTDQVYLTGGITGINTDIDPTAGVFPINSNGSSDIFLVKYTWLSNTPPAGTLQGNTICLGDLAQLTFNATTGTGPFQLTISNGTTTWVQTNVQSGVPFTINPSPAATTTYTLVGIKDASRCSPTMMNAGTATLTVNNCNAVPDFQVPATVCLGEPVTITNTSQNASSYYWSFCESNFSATPAAVNLGNPGNQLVQPVFSDLVKDETGNYYGFVTNHIPGGLVRLFYGNSLLNTPVAQSLGNLGGVLPNQAEGIQVVKANGGWTAVIVGTSWVAKVDFGASLANPAPLATNWGNIGSLTSPHDLHLFTVSNQWYGFTVNALSNSITRFSFGTDFSATPTGTNLGNIGTLNTPVGIGVVKSGTNWHLFATNAGNSTLSRLDFGTSLLNTPAGTNVGNPGNALANPRDISFIQLCNDYTAICVNATNNTIGKLNFGSSITAVPTGTSLGNLGALSFPHSISELFRDGSDVYAFVTNVNTNSVTRLRFEGCGMPGSDLQNPAPITYTQPGTYNINLMLDLGLPTQASICKQVIVQDCRPGSFCDSWLRLPSQGSYVTVGDLDVTGNKLTVEALVNRVPPLNNGSHWGHLVSKHTDASNVNYALQLLGCEITTDVTGYVALSPSCQPVTDKTYHVAMVYDGVTLKYYRNGYLMAQAPCTGNMINNDLITKIGQVAGPTNPINNQVLGYTNEVRVWNVARTQAEIRASMSGPLANPTITPGLLAYYSFNNLINKQGNTAFNGTLNGSAQVGQTNPICTVAQDSCELVVAPGCPGSQLSIGTSAYERAYDVIPVSDGYYTAGVTRVMGNDDIIVTKLDFNNNVVWSKRFGGSGAESVRKIAAASDGGVLITGQTKSAGNPTGDILALKVSTTGTLVWARKFGLNTPNGDLGMDIIETSDGGYAISGIINVNGGVADAVVIKLNNALNAQWIQRYDRGDGEDGVGILQKGDTLIVSVDLQNSAGHYENLVMKLRMSDGVVLAARKLTPAARGLFNGYLFHNPSQPGYVLSGHTIDNSSYANMKHTILTLDENFNVLRTRLISVNPVTNDFFTGLVPLADGGFIGVASPQNSPDAYVYRVNNTNNIVYSKRINAAGERRFQRVVLSGQNVIAVGAAMTGANEDILYTNFNSLNPPSDWCDMENATITIEQPVYTTSAFTWPTITAPSFASPALALTLSDITLQTTDLCPCIRDTIINDYTPALSLDICKNILQVEDATKFNVGDTVLLIQMKGATIDVTNTAAFGSVTDYRNSGNYEFNYIKSKTGNSIELLNVVERQYNFTDGKVQLITVPYYQDMTITDRLTCLPWNGNKGGVLVFNVQNAITMSGGGRMDVSGRGFKGAASVNTGLLVTNCFTNNYFYPSGSTISATKGETFSIIPPAFANGKGAAANAGGGGLDHNSGGGGGGNGGVGGFGGYQLEPCGSAPFDNRGIGGRSIPYSNAANKIFLGGGGGAGHANNPDNSSQPSHGANGGGIIIVSANTLQGPANSYIISNGADAPGCSGPDCHDGMGGGGAGGTVLLNIANVATNTTVNVRGGKGANVTGSVPAAGRIGPGGGGAGGVVWTAGAAMPATVTVDAAGGINGVLTTDANNPWGATTGANGISVTDLQLPVDDVLFKPNIDSVRYNTLMTACNIFNFEGLAFINTHAVASWQWSFGDNTFANTQNATHTYTTSGTHPVKLIITDINGCKDSITKDVNADILNFDFSYQQDICNPLSVQFTGTGTTVTNPYWSFGDNTTATGILNPIHNYTAQGTYTVQYSVTGANGCPDTVVKMIPIIIIIRDNVVLTRDTTICAGTTKQLLSVPALAYCWTPSTYLSDPSIQNPVTSTPGNITYFLTTETQGPNLIVNGNFNNGNTGFTSQYNFVSTNVTEGQYFVGPNPTAWNGGLSPCTDHTTGSGNMMLVNGSPTPDVKVWTQTVNVTPNTNYAFATWVQALFTPNPARLSFSINGRDLGTPITASLPTCTWTKFYTTWNSGNNTTAVISIVNKNTQVLGNDFALDDISFSEVMIKRDSVIITVDTPLVRTTDDLAVCPGTPVQLNTTGAQTYVWNASSTLSNTTIPDPVATPTINTQYIVTGTNVNGCVAKDTVNINVHTRPTITVTDDVQICRNATIQLSATGGLSYLWTPPGTLDNPTSPTPVATPTADTWYYVNVTDNNTCTWRDSVLVTLRPEPVFTLTPATASICAGQSVQLHAGGGTTYSWTPAGDMDDPTVANPTVTPGGTTAYSVTVSEGICNRSQILSVTVNVERPVVVTNDNTTICKGTSIQFNTSGAQNYSWNQPGTLSSPSIPNPVATPTAPTQYIVTGTTATGCTAKDTVNIDFYPAPLITTTDDADICRNASIQLSTTGGTSYTWSPAATLSNASIANPVATPAANTMYYVDITDVNNCVHRDSVEIRIRPDVVFSLAAAAPVCLGNTVQLNASGGDTYSWQASPTLSNTGIANPVASPATTETYFVTISESFCGHSETLSTTVRVNPLPTIRINKSNDIDCSYDRAQLSATGAAQYIWAPAGTLSNPSIPNPVATPTATTDYTVTATDANGCTNTGIVTVKVEAINEGKYLMANGFTPNGDGLNDCYGVKLWGIIQEIEFSIYNRWGERVFYSTQPNACWDGVYKGVKQDSGVFVYMVKAKTNCAPSVFRKGTFVLIR